MTEIPGVTCNPFQGPQKPGSMGLVAVVPKSGQAVSPEEIAQWRRERLAPMKVPRFVAIVDNLPHTPTHKVAKAVMRSDRTLVQRAVDLEKAASGTQ